VKRLAVLAALIAAFFPAAGRGHPQSDVKPPVDLLSCRIAMLMPTAIGPKPPGPLIGGVAVKFVNRSPRVETQIVLSVTDDDRTELMTARGTFSPGVTIEKQFANFTGLNYWREEPDACSIVRVAFADGSTWTAHAR
jgi:hypothetical protein